MSVRILVGDCRTRLRELQEKSVQTCVTSPPYFGLRDYGMADQIGLEQTPDAFVAELVAVFREVKRVLRDDGTLWLNIGDTYSATRWSSGGGQGINGNTDTHRSGNHSKNSGVPDKNILMIPHRVALGLQADGWFIRQDIVWHKPMTMPEPVHDRCVRAHEYIFLCSKSPRYYYDAEAIMEPVKQPTKHPVSGKEYTHAHKRSVWSVSPKRFEGAHFATFPPDLIEPCIKAGSKAGDVVLDPFGGAGTTGLVADRLGRDAVLCELNPAYAAMAGERIRGENPMFTNVSVLPSAA